MAGNTSTLPPSVRKQAKRAQELYDTVYGTEDRDGLDKEAAPEKTDYIAPVPDPQVASGQAEPDTTPEVPSKDTPTESEQVEADTELEKANQRYRVLQGKYNAEVPRMSRQLREIEDELTNTRAILASMEKPAATQSDPGAATTDYATLISDEERTDYGEDLLDVVGRRAKQELQPHIDALLREQEQLKAQVGGVSQKLAQSAQDQIRLDLAASVPEWESLNNDSGFNSWLNDADLFSGVPRRKLLHEAYYQGDSRRVIAIFQAYNQENAAVAPPTPAHDTTSPAPEGGNGQAKVPLAQLVAPGRPREGRTASAQNQNEEAFSRSSIARFYADITAGKFRNREKQRADIERRISRAVRDGRVLNN